MTMESHDIVTGPGVAEVKIGVKPWRMVHCAVHREAPAPVKGHLLHLQRRAAARTVHLRERPSVSARPRVVRSPL
jgi:hypothetical protein